MSEPTRFRVVEPALPWELFNLFHLAAAAGTEATFKAVACGVTPIKGITPRTFVVKVKSAEYNNPAAFLVEDEGEHVFNVVLPGFGHAEFNLFD